MGSQQSTRRVTVMSDEASGVIKISDSVVDRLRNELEKPPSNSSNSSQSAKPPEPEVNQTPPPPPPPPAPKEEPVEAPAPPPQAPIPNQKPIIQYVERDPSLSSLRVKAEKEKEMAEAETYWRKRFVQQEQEHTALTHLQTNHLKVTAEKLSKMFATEKCPPICLEEREAVLQCYKSNPNRTLMCSDVVKNFSRCVHSARMASG